MRTRHILGHHLQPYCLTRKLTRLITCHILAYDPSVLTFLGHHVGGICAAFKRHLLRCLDSPNLWVSLSRLVEQSNISMTALMQLSECYLCILEFKACMHDSSAVELCQENLRQGPLSYKWKSLIHSGPQCPRVERLGGNKDTVRSDPEARTPRMSYGRIDCKVR